MPIYEEEGRLTREELLDLCQQNKCKFCGGMLNVFMDYDADKAFLACNDWQRTHHEGIEREASRYETEGLAALNIPTRRNLMAQQYGEAKTEVLAKYGGVVSLTRVQATEILKTIWPSAPDIEVLKAAMICQQYGLNPLMKHVFLIPFKRREKGVVVGEDWVPILGINSNRLIAQRHHNYSYLDLTPRRMTDQEQEKVLGGVDDSRVWAITMIKDMDTGAEAMGVGSWPKDESPYGVEKGNTILNMAVIRSERQALDRQYPGEMPQGVDVIDEGYAQIEAKPFIIRPEGDEKSGESEQVRARGGGEGETILSSQKEGKTDKNSGARRPDDVSKADVRNSTDLLREANACWGLQPEQVWEKLEYTDQRHFVDAAVESPWECFCKLKAGFF